MFAKAVNKMGYCDAIEDGIETVGGKFGYYYRIPCEICGEKIRRTQYSRKRNYICDYCKGVIKKKQKAKIPEELQDVKTKKELQFDKAIKEIEQQSKCYDEYKKSIEIARKRLELYGSIPETMVAIELIKNGYSIIPQQKIGRYKVDFLIPKEKIVVEVDGEIFHAKERNEDREATIQISLGFDWKIIHIPAEKIRKDISKTDIIIKRLQEL